MASQLGVFLFVPAIGSPVLEENLPLNIAALVALRELACVLLQPAHGLRVTAGRGEYARYLAARFRRVCLAEGVEREVGRDTAGTRPGEQLHQHRPLALPLAASNASGLNGILRAYPRGPSFPACDAARFLRVVGLPPASSLAHDRS